MTEYKVLRTKYATDTYANATTIEERLNEAAKEGWEVERMTSAQVSVSSVIETYLLSREEDIHAQVVKDLYTRTSEDKGVAWVLLPDDANAERWEETYKQMRSVAAGQAYGGPYGSEAAKYTLATMPGRWSPALTILKDELPSEFVNLYHDWKAKYGDDWWAHNGWHFFGGQDVRNLLRSKGYDEKYFGIDNLDDIYINLIELAMELWHG